MEFYWIAYWNDDRWCSNSTLPEQYFTVAFTPSRLVDGLPAPIEPADIAAAVGSFWIAEGRTGTVLIFSTAEDAAVAALLVGAAGA